MATSTPSESPQDPTPGGSSPRGGTELADLQRLRDSGALSAEEYARAARAVTGSEAQQPADGPAADQLPPVPPATDAAPVDPAGPGAQASAEPGTGAPPGPQDAGDKAGGAAAAAGVAAGSATAGPDYVRTAEVQELRKLAKNWWIFLVTGLLWVIVALILMQFSTRSVATVGYVTGALLIAAGVEYLYVGTVTRRLKWVWFVFGVVFVFGGVWAFINPGRTAAALALSLGLLFALIGVLWIVEAVAQRTEYHLWWLGLGSGVIMLGLAVWAANQTTVAKMAMLLWVAMVWAIFAAVTDIFRAFYVRRFGIMMKSIRD